MPSSSGTAQGLERSRFAIIAAVKPSFRQIQGRNCDAQRSSLRKGLVVTLKELYGRVLTLFEYESILLL